MGDMNDQLREVMGLLGNIVPPQKPLPDLLLATYHEARGWNACREAMLALIRQHGPALLARQEGEEGWLPIESAPKDGTYILLFGDMEQPYVSNYDTFRDGFGDRYTGWVSPDAGELGPGLMSPTHWRPLPALPAARSGGGG